MGRTQGHVATGMLKSEVDLFDLPQDLQCLLIGCPLEGVSKFYLLPELLKKKSEFFALTMM